MRLCQTMAFATGFPVARSQTIVVSRWLVTPIAAMSAADEPRLAPAPRARSQLRRPDGFRIVLDVAGRRKDLRELLLRHRHDRAVAPEDDRAARGRALIEREDESAHDTSPRSAPAVSPGGDVTGASGG